MCLLSCLLSCLIGYSTAFEPRNLCFVSEAATVFMNAGSGYYDPDEDIRSSSPPLVPIPVKYKPEKTPPPYFETSSSSGSASPAPGRGKARPDSDKSAYRPVKQLKRKGRKKRRTRPSQGDAVLISYLEPNRPDIAQEAAQRALNSASQSEVGDELDEDMGSDAEDGEDDGGTEEKHRDSAHAATELKSTAWAALRDDVVEHYAPRRPVISAFLAKPEEVSGIMEKHSSNGDDATQQPRLNRVCESAGPLGSTHPPQPLKVLVAPSEGNCDGRDESITTSPALAKFAISAAEANPESTLPAMQKSPPRSTSNHSPEGTQSLPSLQTTLNQIADRPIVETPILSPFPQIPGPSPTLTRSRYSTGTAGPSPTVYSQSSPSSSKDMTNTASPGFPNHSSKWHNPSQEGSNGLFTSNTFRCTHPGCTAQPFQTQYLLNSHANVHSSDRPHHCPEKSCSRNIHGKGFKRKNEMIRHGLVHKSPGYACPFCAEQQHKYPRPDNLQRYFLYQSLTP